MTAAPVYLDRRDDVAVMVLNRPDKHNAMNHEIWRLIPELAAEVAEDLNSTVLVVRGAGGRAFAAGADIAEFPVVHATAETARAYHADVHAAYESLANLQKPTIAMISGVCFGGGCALSLCCDLRYADETSRFSIPPAKLGLAYSLRETKRLADLVGPAKAMEMLCGARVLDGEEALATGLVTRLFPSADLEAETFAFAKELTNLSQYTIRAVKRMVQLISSGVTDDVDETRDLMMGSFTQPDYQEGRDAFLQKRAPRFRYR